MRPAIPIASFCVVPLAGLRHVINRDDRKSIERTLEQAENQLDDGIQFLTLALELMTDPHTMYRTGSEAVRVILNRTIFTKLYVDGDTITGHELREPFSVLADAYSAWQGYPKDTDTASGLRALSRATGPRSPLHATVPTQHSSAAPEVEYGATSDHAASPALTLAVQGSNKIPMVELLAYSHSTQAADLRLCIRRTADLT